MFERFMHPTMREQHHYIGSLILGAVLLLAQAALFAHQFQHESIDTDAVCTLCLYSNHTADAIPAGATFDDSAPLICFFNQPKHSLCSTDCVGYSPRAPPAIAV